MTAPRSRGRPKGGYLPDTERKPSLARIKERHRVLAKYLAAGLTRAEIAARLDYTVERVSTLSLDPAMQQLVAEYRNHPQVEEMVGYNDIAQLRALSAQIATRSAMAMIDKLDYYQDAGEEVPVREAAKMFELASDRIGFGRHQTNVNVNIDFATQLEQRRLARLKLVSVQEAAPQVPSAPGKELRLTPAPSTHGREPTKEQGAMGEVATSLQPHASPHVLVGMGEEQVVEVVGTLPPAPRIRRYG